jgi:hypothetical protein
VARVEAWSSRHRRLREAEQTKRHGPRSFVQWESGSLRSLADNRRSATHGWNTGVMAFVADDLAAWLIALMADGVRRRLTTLVLGDELDRALGSAAKAAIGQTAADLCPDDTEQAEQVAAVINEVFRTPVSDALLARPTTMLRAIEAGITNQLAVLDDASLTGTGVSSADVLGIPAGELADKLTDHLVQQIALRATRGGALEPLAAQLNHDRTHLQGQEIYDALLHIRSEILEAIAPLTVAARDALPQSPELPDIDRYVAECFDGLNIDEHEKAERRIAQLFQQLTRTEQRAVVEAILHVVTSSTDHATQLVGCALQEAADRLDPTLITIEDIEALDGAPQAPGNSPRGSAAVLLWQWAESNPGRVPVPLLSKLAQPSKQDWYVHSPARAGAKQLLLVRPSAQAIYDIMASSQDPNDRSYAVTDLVEVAKIEPRVVPIHLARRLAVDDEESVAAHGTKLLRMLSGITDADRWNYRHRFGI